MGPNQVLQSLALAAALTAAGIAAAPPLAAANHTEDNLAACHDPDEGLPAGITKSDAASVDPGAAYGWTFSLPALLNAAVVVDATQGGADQWILWFADCQNRVATKVACTVGNACDAVFATILPPLQAIDFVITYVNPNADTTSFAFVTVVVA